MERSKRQVKEIEQRPKDGREWREREKGGDRKRAIWVIFWQYVVQIKWDTIATSEHTQVWVLYWWQMYSFSCCYILWYMFKSFDGGKAWHLFYISHFLRKLFFTMPGKVHYLSLYKPKTVQCVPLLFSNRRWFQSTKEKKGGRNKEKTHSCPRFFFLCCAVLRKDRDRVGEGEHSCKDRKWRGVDKTIETENTLLLILSEGHSHSLQFQPAAGLASLQQRGTGCSRIHTHTLTQTIIHVSCL